MRITLGIIFVVLTCVTAQGQFNFTAGYRAGFLSGDNFINVYLDSLGSTSASESRQTENTRIVYDTLYADDGYQNFRYLNGVDLGLTYRKDNWIFEASWKNKRKESKATFVTEQRRFIKDTSGIEFLESRSRSENNHRVTTSINSASIGAQHTIDFVSVGMTLDYNWLKVSSNFEGMDDPEDLKDQRLSSHISLSFNFGESGSLGFTLQPYAQIFWSEFQLDSADGVTRSGKLNNFGIALIVRNGPQRPW